MYLLNQQCSATRVIALFGNGLIGSSIFTSLNVHSLFTTDTLDFSFTDFIKQRNNLTIIVDKINQLCLKGTTDLCFIWSAGITGFFSTEEETLTEFENFKTILNLSTTFLASGKAKNVSFHMISSAGGLFEGNTNISKSSKPKPQRPYGILKQKQEELLLLAPTQLKKRIYRLSSVFGYIKKGHRMGLVSTLVYNGTNHFVNHIYGNISTLRDFVWCGDVGKYISQEILSENSPENSRIDFLVSGKPTSIFEVQIIVERILGKKTFIAFRDTYKNSSDITFSKSILPKNWHSIDIETAIHTIFFHWRNYGITFRKY